MREAEVHTSVIVNVSDIVVRRGHYAQMRAWMANVTVELRFDEDGTIVICTNRPDLVKTFDEVYDMEYGPTYKSMTE